MITALVSTLKVFPANLPRLRAPGGVARLRRYGLALAFLWSVFLVMSSLSALYNSQQSALDAAYMEAYASINKDLVYRQWAAAYGGVYVPQHQAGAFGTDPRESQPQALTSAGEPLLLLSPASVLRQAHAVEQVMYGTRGHLTSQDATRPGNQPDAWEAAALRAFAQGETAASAVATLDGQPVLRYIQAISAGPACDDCPFAAGSRPGDLRGALSVTIPLQPHLDAQQPVRLGIIGGHGLLWLLGLVGLLWGYQRLQASLRLEADSARQIANSEARYRQMFEDNQAIKLLIDPLSGQIVDANSAAADFYGWPLEQLQRMRIQQINTLPEADVLAEMARATHQARTYFQFQHRLASGEVCDVDVFSSPVDMPEGRLLYSIVVDTSAQRQAEARLRESERRHRSLFEQSNDAVFILDLQGRHQQANLRAAEMFGYTPAEIAALSYKELVMPQEHGQSRDVFARLTAGERIPPYERTFRHKDGRPVPVEVNIEAVRDDDGQPLHFQSILHDISERKQGQQRAFQLALERERMDLLTQFIQNAAHEFRTPLSTISTRLYLMQRNTDNPACLDAHVTEAKTQVNRITRLVDMLLLMAQLDAGGGQTLAHINVKLLLEELCNCPAHQAAAGPEVVCNLPPELPPVLGDVDYLAEAFHQLLDNACRFTPPEGQVTVSAAVGGGQFRLRIADTGPGIPPEAIPYIFETFWRQDEAHTTPGFGLGLPIARKIIEAHGGQLAVESVPGAGTAFLVTLPVLAGG